MPCMKLENDGDATGIQTHCTQPGSPPPRSKFCPTNCTRTAAKKGKQQHAFLILVAASPPPVPVLRVQSILLSPEQSSSVSKAAPLVLTSWPLWSQILPRHRAIEPLPARRIHLDALSQLL